MASADGWTTFPAERQGAVIEMRAGQRGGPLPFEASFDFGERIIKTKVTAKRWLRRTRDINSGVFCNRVCVTLKSRKPFLDKENREGGANNLVFEFRGNQTDAPDERGRRIERETHGRINDAAQRRTRTKHQPILVLRLRAASLLEGVQLGDGGRGNERAISDRSSVIVLRHVLSMHQPIQRRARYKHQPIRVLRLRAASLLEGVQLDEGGRRNERATSDKSSVSVQRLGQTRHQPIRVLRLRAASPLEGVQLDEGGRRNERAISDKSSVTVQRHGQTRHQPIRVLRLRAASLLEGVQTQQTQAMSTNDGTLVGDATGAQLLEGFAAQRTHGIIQSPGSNDASSTLQMKFFQRTMVTMLHTLMNLRVHVPDQTMGSSVFHAADLMSNESRGKPAQVLLLRAASPRAGEAQVEAEGDEVTLPVVEPMTAATLCGVFGTEYTSRAQAEAIWSEPITTDL